MNIEKWTAKMQDFINLNIMSSCIKRVGQLCKEAGVVLTNIGAIFPYENDPQASNIRMKKMNLKHLNKG